MDAYIKRCLKEVKNAKTDEELAKLIDEIFDNGYDLGVSDTHFFYGGYFS